MLKDIYNKMHIMPPPHLTLANPKSGFLKLSARTIDII